MSATGSPSGREETGTGMRPGAPDGSQHSQSEPLLNAEPSRILMDPGAVLEAFCRKHSHEHPELMDLRYVTELRVGLMIERDRRIFLGAAGNSLLAMSREEISTALLQVMRNSGVASATEYWYDRLWEWHNQGPIFRRDDTDGDAATGAVRVSGPEEPDRTSSPPEDTWPLREER